MSEDSTYSLHVYPGTLSERCDVQTVRATKRTTAGEVVQVATSRLGFDDDSRFVLVELHKHRGEETVLAESDHPVQRMLLWPRQFQHSYRFLLRQTDKDGTVLYQGATGWQAKVNQDSTQRDMAQKGFLPPTEPAQEDYPDLCALSNLTQDEILEVLKMRFLKDKIYTYTGDMLISVNPYNFLPIYNPKYMTIYQNRKKEELAPHIYAVADTAFTSMVRSKQNQCVVITGKSGSGKTQATHFLVHHTLALCQKSYMTGVEHMLIGCGPVLEALGNAQTEHNYNSSRFGKFLRIYFYESGLLSGADIQTYLLEKSRLVHQEWSERNFHIFYYLLCGASTEELNELHLDRDTQYDYISKNMSHLMSKQEASAELERLRQAMEVVGFFAGAQCNIFRLISAILQLGNITFKVKKGRDEALEIEDESYLHAVSELLGLDSDNVKNCLLTRKARAGAGERFVLDLKLNEANATRDAMAKGLYQMLFEWTVYNINMALAQRTRDNKLRLQSRWIGLLDIFGFEDFVTNSFEQFCINYASEHLQHYCIKHTFQMEQEEYKLEGLAWKEVDYADNSGCLELYEKKPMGLFYLIDENFPGANNQTLLSQFNRVHSTNRYYESPVVKEDAFIIKHFAGKVKYRIKDFREKNHDQVREDIIKLLCGTRSSFVREVVAKSPAAIFRWSVLRAVVRAASAFKSGANKQTLGDHPRSTRLKWQYSLLEEKNTQATYVHKKMMARLTHHESNVTDCSPRMENGSLYGKRKPAPSRPKKKSNSISQQYQASMVALLNALEKAHPYFVRCIQPNNKKVPLELDDQLFLHQLRCSGTLQTIQLQQSRYTVRSTTDQFLQQYKLLFPRATNKLTLREIEAYLISLGLALPTDFQTGKTQVFLRDPACHVLREELHKAVLTRVVLLQSLVRTYVARKFYLRQKAAALKIQSFWRMIEAQNEIEEWHLAASIIQGAWHNYQNRKLEAFIIRVQAHCRGHLARLKKSDRLNVKKVLQKQNRSAEVIQAAWKDYWCRKTKRKQAALTIQRYYRGFIGRKLHYETREDLSSKRPIPAAIPLEDIPYMDDVEVPKSESARLKTQLFDSNEVELTNDPKIEDARTDDDGRSNISLKESASLVEPEPLAKGVEPSIAVAQPAAVDGEAKTNAVLNAVRVDTDVVVSDLRSGDVEPSVNAAVYDENVTSNLCENHTDHVTASHEKESSLDTHDKLTHEKQTEFRITLPNDHDARLLKAKETSVTNITSGLDELTTKPSHGESVQTKTSSIAFNKTENQSDSEAIPASVRLKQVLSRENETPVATNGGRPTSSKPAGDIVQPVMFKPSHKHNRTQFDERDITDSRKRDSYNLLKPATKVSTGVSKYTSVSSQADRLVDVEKQNHLLNKDKNLLENSNNITSAVPTISLDDVVISMSSDGMNKEDNKIMESTDVKVDETTETSRSKYQETDFPAENMKVSDASHKEGLSQLQNEWLAFQRMEHERQLVEFDRSQEGPRVENKKEREIREEIASLRLKQMQTLKEKMDSVGVGVESMPGLRLCSRSASLHGHRGTSSPPASLRENRSRSVMENKEMIELTPASTFPRSVSMETVPTSSIKRKKQRSNSAIDSPVELMIRPTSIFLPKKPSSFNAEAFAKKCMEEQLKAEDGSSTDGGDVESKIEISSPMDPGKRASTFIETMKKTFWGSHKGQAKQHLPVAEKKSNDIILNTSPLLSHEKPTTEESAVREVKFRSLEAERFSPKLLVSRSDDLLVLETFLRSKTSSFQGSHLVDQVFKISLLEYCKNLTAIYSLTERSGTTDRLRYKDIVGNFRQVLEKTANHYSLDQYAAMMAVNGFRSYMDEFMNDILPKHVKKAKEESVKEAKAKKKKQKDDPTDRLGHRFSTVQWGITQICEHCRTTMWLMESGLVCKTCKFACHKKCSKQLAIRCPGSTTSEQSGMKPRKLFGEELVSLEGSDGLVPAFIDKCISYMEMNGLYLEGVYRKSAASTQNKLLIDALNKDVECQRINFDDFNIHCVASVFKKFLRSLPHPLVPYDKYFEFLQASKLTNEREKVNSLFAVLEGVPPNNHATLERIIFHLARVAQQEKTNLMSPSNLAIVFTPCFLAPPSHVSPIEGAKQVGALTKGIELVISEQVKKIKSTLESISEIQHVEDSTNEKLRKVRKSMGKEKRRRIRPSFREGPQSPTQRRSLADTRFPLDAVEEDTDLAKEEQEYEETIASLKSRKESLTTGLPALAPLVADDRAFHGDGFNFSGNNEYLRHLNKHRVSSLPPKRRPSRYESTIYSPHAPSPAKEDTKRLRKITPKGKKKRLAALAQVAGPSSFKRSSVMRNPIHRLHRKSGANMDSEQFINKDARVGKMTSV